jgi:protein-S-isoprenylcysteine O-methyltransferase Ste14
MTATLVGVAGFLVLLWVEPAGLAGRRILERALLASGRAMVVGAHLLALLLSPYLSVPAGLRFAGTPVALAGFLLLLQSLVFELPVDRSTGRPGGPRRLTSTGTYALVRHPGVLWFALWMAGLAAVSGARDILFAAPVWIATNAAYAWAEDRFTFPRMFGAAYEAYRRQVPMFLPTRASLVRFRRSFRAFRPGATGDSGPVSGGG